MRQLAVHTLLFIIVWANRYVSTCNDLRGLKCFNLGLKYTYLYFKWSIYRTISQFPSSSTYPEPTVYTENHAPHKFTPIDETGFLKRKCNRLVANAIAKTLCHVVCLSYLTCTMIMTAIDDRDLCKRRHTTAIIAIAGTLRQNLILPRIVMLWQPDIDPSGSLFDVDTAACARYFIYYPNRTCSVLLNVLDSASIINHPGTSFNLATQAAQFISTQKKRKPCIAPKFLLMYVKWNVLHVLA